MSHYCLKGQTYSDTRVHKCNLYVDYRAAIDSDKSLVFIIRSIKSANLREASRMNRVWSVAWERVSSDARRGVSSIS